MVTPRLRAIRNRDAAWGQQPWNDTSAYPPQLTHVFRLDSVLSFQATGFRISYKIALLAPFQPTADHKRECNNTTRDVKEVTSTSQLAYLDAVVCYRGPLPHQNQCVRHLNPRQLKSPILSHPRSLGRSLGDPQRSSRSMSPPALLPRTPWLRANLAPAQQPDARPKMNPVTRMACACTPRWPC